MLPETSGFRVDGLLEVPRTDGMKSQARTSSRLLAFVNAVDDEDLAEHVRVFGPVLSRTMLPPGIEEGRAEEGSHEAFVVEETGALRTEQRRLRSLLNLVRILKSDPLERADLLDAVRAVSDVFGAGESPVVPIDKELIRRIEKYSTTNAELLVLEDLVEFLKPFALAPVVVEGDRGGRPFVDFGPNPQSTTPLSLMYGQLLQELLGYGALRSCQNPRCGTFFRPARPNKYYCCEVCQKRAKAARHYGVARKRRTSRRTVKRGPIAKQAPSDKEGRDRRRRP